MSDHRPVAADFSVDFDLYEKAEYEATVRRLYREIHALDGSHERPAIKLDQSYVDFGEIRYQTRLAKKVTIENAGKVRYISHVALAATTHGPDSMRMEICTSAIRGSHSPGVVVNRTVDWDVYAGRKDRDSVDSPDRQSCYIYPQSRTPRHERNADTSHCTRERSLHCDLWRIL